MLDKDKNIYRICFPDPSGRNMGPGCRSCSFTSGYSHIVRGRISNSC